MWKWLFLFLFFREAEKVFSANETTSVTVTESTISYSTASVSASADVSPNASSDSTAFSRTVTLELSQSILGDNSENIVQPSATAASQQTSQTINASVTAPPELGCMNVNWGDPECQDVECVEDQMDAVSNCMKDKPENFSLSNMKVPEQVVKTGMSLAEAIQSKDKNKTRVIIRDNIAMEVGLFNSGEMKNNFKKPTLVFPNYSDPKFTDKWKAMGDSVAFPVDKLPFEGEVAYSVAILPDVVGESYLDKDMIAWQDNHIPDSALSELYVVGDKLMTRKEVPRRRINSNLLSAEFRHKNKSEMLSGRLEKPALITLKHRHTTEDHFDPRCVFWDGNLEAWSNDGCKVGKTGKSETVCECTHFSTFALIMSVNEKVDDADRKMVVTVATVLGSFSLLALLICAAVAIVLTYHQRDNMRIALNVDVSLLLSQLVFFIGLSTGDNSYFAKPKTCDVVNPFVHFFELAALTWLLMEAVHYYSTLKPLFNEKNTVPIVFYFAVGWGVPVAFASALADFAYPHFGDPGRSEFCWMSIRGGEAWFFGTQVLVLVVLNLAARAFIAKEIACWEGDPDDIKIERARNRMLTSLVLMVVIVMTWLFGVLAMNNTDRKIFHYVFIVFYTFQGLLVLLFYCVRNQEMWDYRKDKKDEEEKEKNKTYDFVYHP